MKDANIGVVTVAANCVEILAKGLQRAFARYRGIIISPMMERLKEKKQSVTDAICLALDAVFGATSLGECLEDIMEYIKHKNPQVKLESTRFLIRCLRNTKEVPQPPAVKSIADAATKLLTDSQEVQRVAGAEALGTLWKIIGDKAMGPHLNDLDDIRKAKIKEFYETAEVKAKSKPKAAAPQPKAAVAQKRMGMVGGRKPGARKPARPSSPPLVEEPPTPAPAARPPPKSASKIGGPKSGLHQPGGLRPPSGVQKRGIQPPSGLSSPMRRVASPTDENLDAARRPHRRSSAPAPAAGSPRARWGGPNQRRSSPRRPWSRRRGSRASGRPSAPSSRSCGPRRSGCGARPSTCARTRRGWPRSWPS